MNFIFAGLEDDPNKDPYDSLTELSTVLAVSEEGLVPLDPIADTVLKALEKKPNDGDVQVMAARALAHLLDKFTPSFSIFMRKKRPSSVTTCFKTIFSLVSDPKGAKKREFKQTTSAELTEELLKCLTLGSSSTEAVRSVMPSTDVQLRFCESSLDGTKWTSCKVIRHCGLLARCGSLASSEQRRVVKQLLYRHLDTLSALDVDYEWDELLRAVTEAIVSLRVWCPEPGRGGNNGPPAHHGKKEELHRSSSASIGGKHTAKARGTVASSTAVRPSRQDEASQAVESAQVTSTEELYIKLCLRVCRQDGMAESRKQLVLACTNAVLHARDTAAKVGSPSRAAFLALLVSLLTDTAQMVISFSDPFVRKDRATSSADDEDNFKPLPNLQWEVPVTQWTALMLIAKLLGAEPETEKEYVWGFRGDGDIWYWYNGKERAALSTAFFNRKAEVPLRGGEHGVSLLGMTDTHKPTQMVARVHFQPIPCAYRFHNNAPLSDIHKASQLIGQYEPSLWESVRKLLQILSFGTTAPARLAKAVYLHAVCHTAPDNSEGTRSAFRNLVTEYPTSVLESIVKDLVARDAGWAAVLCDAGMANAIAETVKGERRSVERAEAEVDDDAAPAKRMRREAAPAIRAVTPTRRPKASAPSHRGTNGGESPVVKLLRETVAASQRGSRQAGPLPVSLPHPITASVVHRLSQSSFTEVVDMLHSTGDQNNEEGSFTLADDAMSELKDWLATDAEGRRRVTSAVVAALLSQLQEMSITGKRTELVDVIAERELLRISICDPPSTDNEEESGDGAGDRSAGLRCPQGHSLRVHFSTNWKCNKCGYHTGYGSSACRACNYDLCHECADKLANRLLVNPTATVGDVLRVWLARQETTAGHTKARARADDGKEPHDADGKAADVFRTTFVDRHTIPASAPAVALTSAREQKRVHCGGAFAKCFCSSSTCPSSLIYPVFHRCGSEAGQSLFSALLSICAPEIVGDRSVVHALVEAVESLAPILFLDGVRSLPNQLLVILRWIAPHLPLALKADMAKFLSSDCRRYALYHLQERSVVLRGTVLGEVAGNGLGRKVDVLRDNTEETTRRLYDAFGTLPSSRTKLEFFFEGEEGTGNGPTQELYTELSKAYRELTAMWYATDDGRGIAFPSCKALFWRHFFVLGAACARAFVDGYVMDIALLPSVWHLLRAETKGDSRGARLTALRELDPALVRSYEQLLASSDEDLDAMALFDANDNAITTATVAAYVDTCIEEHLEVGLENLRAFGLGMLTSVDLALFWMLSDEELSIVMGGQRGAVTTADGEKARLFSAKELLAVTLAAHGYTADSAEVRMFVDIVGEDFSYEQQSFFLEFLTGSARLPLNGLPGLGRKITVVRKEVDDGAKQQTLPSCNTCFLYLKLPPYRTRDVMKERLLVAITEGRKNFSLS